jgi:hypothetical protein
MRKRVTAARLQEFMKTLAGVVTEPTRIFLVGGATAVLCGWRESTIDIDLKIFPESDEILRSLPALKERLQVNVELASPDHFIPVLPSWEARSRFIQQEGKLTFLHYDFYAQALAKIERGHQIDLMDVAEMLKNGFVEPDRLLELFTEIESELYKYPALNAQAFRSKVERVVRDKGGATQE